MRRAVENDTGTCSGCGASIIYARAENEQLVPIDDEMREDGRIVLVQGSDDELPRIWWLNDEELEASKSAHERRVDMKIEEPGPHRLYVFHDCRETKPPAES